MRVKREWHLSNGRHRVVLAHAKRAVAQLPPPLAKRNGLLGELVLPEILPEILPPLRLPSDAPSSREGARGMRRAERREKWPVLETVCS